MIGAANVANWLAKGAPASIEEKPGPAAVIFDVHPYGPFGLAPGPDRDRRSSSAGFRAKHLRPVEVRHGAGARLAKAREMRRNAKTILTEMPDPARDARPLRAPASARCSRTSASACRA